MNNRLLVCYSLTDLTNLSSESRKTSTTKPPIGRIADLLACCHIDQQKPISFDFGLFELTIVRFCYT